MKNIFVDFDYSVAIRTLGTAGDKYVKLMNSIKKSNIQPKHVFVVLPEGYKPPEGILGTEEFLFSEKGMVKQRLKALEKIDTEYTLFCDDDVEFDSIFIEKLAKPLLYDGYACSAGPLLEFFPPDEIKYLFASLLGGACRMVRRKKDNYVRILGTAGWSYNKDIITSEHKIYDTESLAWTCFLIKTDVLKSIKLEEEIWLEKNGYAAFDDQTMFYKMIVNDFKIAVVSDALYIHNDGKTSTKDLKLEPVFSHAFNHYIFWHRFLYKCEKRPLKRIWLQCCIEYAMKVSIVHNLFLVMTKRQTKECSDAALLGYREAKRYVKSKEYISLPSVYC